MSSGHHSPTHTFLCDQWIDLHQSFDRPNQARDREQSIQVFLAERDCRRGMRQQVNASYVRDEKFRHGHIADHPIRFEHDAHYGCPHFQSVGNIPQHGNFATRFDSAMQLRFDFCLSLKSEKIAFCYDHRNTYVHHWLRKVRTVPAKVASLAGRTLDAMKHDDWPNNMSAWPWRWTSGMRIFTAMTLLRCSMRLARFAIWIAPEIGGDDARHS